MQKVRGIPVYSLYHCHHYLYYHSPGLTQWNTMEIPCRDEFKSFHLPWFPGKSSFTQRTPLHIYKCLQALASRHLSDLLQPPSSPNLRSSDNNLLSIPSKPTRAELSVLQPCLPACPVSTLQTFLKDNSNAICFRQPTTSPDFGPPAFTFLTSAPLSASINGFMHLKYYRTITTNINTTFIWDFLCRGL